MSFPIPPDEAARLRALRRYDILDSAPEESFDRLARLATRLFGVPVSLVNFVDVERMWSKAQVGLEVCEVRRDLSFCTHALLSDEVLLVEDARADERFASNPFVAGEPGIRFYAGAPLVTPGGHRIGTLCVVDYAPRTPEPRQLAALQDLAAAAVDELELRREVAERRRAETALRAAKKEVEDVLGSIAEGFCALDREWRYTYLNDRFEQITGIPTAELLGRKIWEVFPDLEASTIEHEYRRAVAEQVPVSFEFYFEPLEAWYWIKAYPHKGGLAVYFSDITEQKRAESELRWSEERFRLLAEHTNDLVCLHDAGGRFLYVSPSCRRLLGYEPEELLGQDPYAFFHPDDHVHIRAVQVRLLKGEANPTATYRVRQRSGAYLWVSSNAVLVKDEAGRVVHLVTSSRDIAEQKRAEEALRRINDELETRVAERTANFESVNARLQVELLQREQNERWINQLATLLSHAQEAIWVLEPDGSIVYWNRSAERLYGYEFDECAGRTAQELLGDAEGDQIAPALEAAIADGDWAGELPQRLRDGREVVVESRWTFVRSGEDDPGAILVVSNDITERKALLLRSQRMETLGRLAGGLAHDINNILGPILMSLQMLQVKLTSEQDQRLLRSLEAGTQRGAGLIRQLLSYIRGVEGERTALDAEVLVGEVESILQETLPRSIELSLEAEGDLWPVVGDATQLHQVLMNLCINARDAMLDGGALRLEAANRDVEERDAALHVDARPGRYVVVSVSDTGVGIAPEKLGQIFEPFYTTKGEGKGTGLGLANVASIVKGHGGFLDVQSKPSQGTRFDIYLPASEAGTKIVEEVVVEAPMGGGELVLVVDDNEGLREITCGVLEDCNYQTLGAAHGKEALGLYRQHGPDVRAVITDVMMPEMDGPAMIRALRERGAEVPVIAMSGLNTREDVVKEAGEDVYAFLSKPCRAGALLATLHAALHAAHPPVEAA